MLSEGNDAGAAGSSRPGWLSRTPMWARVAVPIALLVIVAAVVFTVVSTRAVADPDTAMRELCRSASEARLADRGVRDIQVSAAMQVTALSDGYRVQGTATFAEDGAVIHANLRCTLREEDEVWRVTAVRFDS